MPLCPLPSSPLRRGTTRIAVGATALSVALGGAYAYAAVSGQHAGPRADGTAITPIGLRVTPAGSQTTLGELPLDSAMAPDQRHLVIVNAGQGTQSVQVVDTATRQVVQSLPYSKPASVYGGVAFSPDGSRLYVSGGGSNLVHTYDVGADGRLTETAPLALPTTAPGGVKVVPFAAGLAVTPDGNRLVVADQLADAVSVIDLATGTVSTAASGHRPYGVTLSRDGSTAYLADQGGTTVDVVDISGNAPVVTAQISVGTHPARSVLSGDGRTLYVSNGDSDDISVVDTAKARTARTISLAPYRDAEVGTNPLGLTLSPDGRSLYVAASGNNDISVVDTRSGRVSGLIPTGWYPTSVQLAGAKIWAVSGKGLGAGPNDGPGYPNPYSSAPAAENQYSGSMQLGRLSVVAVPDRKALRAYTRQVEANNDTRDRDKVRRPSGSSVIPRRPGRATPIKHVIYVVKENRTFDQVLGSNGRGNADPALNLFGAESAPNTRALAKQFVTFDNFYADAEVSAGGWNWVTAANSNPFSEQQWPANYSSRKGVYPSEASNEPAFVPNRTNDDAYIWQRLAKSNVSFRNYGFYVNTTRGNVNTGTDPLLDAHTDHGFRGFDTSCPDSSRTFTPVGTDCGTPRIDAWLQEFRQYEQSGDLPSVEFVRLPNDHTAGTKAGMPTPRTYVADNDYALGRLVDAVSHSKFWDSTAIFVTEDDAQNGPDHVDAHRTIALVISPWTQRQVVDSTFYSSASMLRTIELIAGVGPLTQFDAFATPMNLAFGKRPVLTAYDVKRPTQPFDARNTEASPLAALSDRQDLTHEDRIDENAFNAAIWQSVKGAGTPVPAAQHRVMGGGVAGE